MYEKIAFINMDINTVITMIEKMQQNLRDFNLNVLLKFEHPLCITEYCIVGFKTIYSYIKSFIFQQIWYWLKWS